MAAKVSSAMRAERPLPLVSVPISVPVLLSIVAGYVDACTFLGLFGLFVAQVTGSFVVAGAQLVAFDHSVLIKVMGIPVFFLAGVLTSVAAVVVTRTGHHPLPWVLAFEALLLVGFMMIALYGGAESGPNAPAALFASLFGLLAMGVQSALVRLLLKDVASTNVMTTNTTQIAIDAGELLMARWRRERAGLPEVATSRRRLRAMLPLAAGFALGSLLGAGAFYFAGLWCVLAAVAITVVLSGWSFCVHELPSTAAD
jgi:uncharacterized membrane protein YoaK (UPF0700 family)